MEERRASEFMNLCDKGHVLLAALMLIVLLGITGMTSLYLAGQDGPGVSAMKEDNARATVGRWCGRCRDELVSRSERHTGIALLDYSPSAKGDLASGPSFFDVAGRSQFVGTADRPDILLDAANQADNQTLNYLPNGFPTTLRRTWPNS